MKDLKEKFKENELRILLNFAENYSFIMQNDVQGYHRNNSQVTLHPIIVYYIESGILCLKSYCLISDCLNHDTNALHKFTSVVLNDIRAKHPNATKCIYFSDGASWQYKIWKNFINLCPHNPDHGLEVEWNFFAISHGKSPCDGIWDTVKRLTAHTSLQMTSGQLISTPYEMFQWCQNNMSGISFFYVSSEDINNHVNQFQLDQCYELTKTAPGTRSYHSFISDGLSKLILQRISKDSFSTAFQLDKATSEISINDIKVRNYYACIYNNEWYICIATDIPS